MAISDEKAARAVTFMQNLKHTKGKWHGVNFDLLPWQDTIIRDVFGTVKDDGFRQYNFAYVEVPKKNGKSELGAAIALYLTCADMEWGAEVYGCACDRSQASIVFDVAVDMVDQCPALKKRIRLILSQRRMVYTPTNSFYQVLSAEAFSKHGLNVHGVVFDELHAQPSRELYDVMTKGSGDARTQPLFFVITTAGDDPDRTSIGWEVHQTAASVLMGTKTDPTFYAAIYGIEPEEKRVWSGKQFQLFSEIDWKDPEIWQLTNPSIGHTIQVDKVAASCQSADGNPADERTFRWLRLNEWIKYKQTKWIGQDVWDRSSTGFVDPERLKGQMCYGGLDLSSKTDITALVLLFPPDGDRVKWSVLPTFWIPEDSMQERVRRDKVPYDKWVREGFIKTTPGNVIDYAFIRRMISGYNPDGNHAHCLRDDYEIRQIGFDPWNASQISLDLNDDGLEMVEVRQGARTMSPAMKEIEKLLVGQELEHGGNPVLRWMFGNLEVKQDENENVRPVKDRSTGRIDGIVALINAMVRAMVQPESNVSIYESQEIFCV